MITEDSTTQHNAEALQALAHLDSVLKLVKYPALDRNEQTVIVNCINTIQKALTQQTPKEDGKDS